MLYTFYESHLSCSLFPFFLHYRSGKPQIMWIKDDTDLPLRFLLPKCIGNIYFYFGVRLEGKITKVIKDKSYSSLPLTFKF